MKKGTIKAGTLIHRLYELVGAGEYDREVMAETLGVSRDNIQIMLFKLVSRKLLAHSGYYIGYRGQKIKTYCHADKAPADVVVIPRPPKKVIDESDDLEGYLLNRKKTYYSNVPSIFEAGRING